MLVPICTMENKFLPAHRHLWKRFEVRSGNVPPIAVFLRRFCVLSLLWQGKTPRSFYFIRTYYNFVTYHCPFIHSVIFFIVVRDVVDPLLTHTFAHTYVQFQVVNLQPDMFSGNVRWGTAIMISKALYHLYSKHCEILYSFGRFWGFIFFWGVTSFQKHISHFVFINKWIITVWVQI